MTRKDAAVRIAVILAKQATARTKEREIRAVLKNGRLTEGTVFVDVSGASIVVRGITGGPIEFIANQRNEDDMMFTFRDYVFSVARAH